MTKGISGEIYNIGGGTELTNVGLTKKLLALMGKDDSYIDYVKDRLGHDRRYSVEYSKIGKLGFMPSDLFEENLARTIAWYQQAINTLSPTTGGDS